MPGILWPLTWTANGDSSISMHSKLINQISYVERAQSDWVFWLSKLDMNFIEFLYIYSYIYTYYYILFGGLMMF